MGVGAEVNLGVGRLTWERSERVSGRYGSVWLMPGADGLESRSQVPIGSVITGVEGHSCVGCDGDLYVDILGVRESTHIGDLALGIMPKKPYVGERIVLGRGVFFGMLLKSGGLAVGVYPRDGRDENWLDPEALYRCHEQSVRLYFRLTGS